jgi:hypothetical protein
MLTSKKHSKSPPEKPIKKISKVTHFTTTFDPLKDTDDESEGSNETSSNRHIPKVVENYTRCIKILFRTKVGDDLFYLKHVNLLKKFQEYPDLVPTVYNKRHEILKSSALDDLQNFAIYNNHFQINQVTIGKNRDEVLTVIIQEYASPVKLHELKRQGNLMSFLKLNGIRISEHDWMPEIWNTQVVGFIPKYTPSCFSKEYVYQHLQEALKDYPAMPEFRIRNIRITKEILGTRISVQVYAIEVKRTHHNMANSQLLKMADTPEDYVSFRTQIVNNKAFQHAVAMTAQIQNDTRTIIIENVSEEAYFIYESQLQHIGEIIGYYHVSATKSIRLVVQTEEFMSIRRLIQKEISTWNGFLDPSDVRQTGYPSLVPIMADDFSEDSSSQMSKSVDSLLTFDIQEFSIFAKTTVTTTTAPGTKPISDITSESIKAQVDMQNEKITDQAQQISELQATIQRLNEDINEKFEKILSIVQASTTTATIETSASGQMLQQESTPHIPTSETAASVKIPGKPKQTTSGNRRR